MTITTNEHGAVLVDGVVTGWVHDSGCENEHCLAAIAAGMPWHAVPRSLPGGGRIIPGGYHYRSAADAIVAVAGHEHSADCAVTAERRELNDELLALTADGNANFLHLKPGSADRFGYLRGAWSEYYGGGDQEVENCDCGAADKYAPPVAGTRVKLVHDVDRYPHFIAPAGATGIVVDVGGVDDETIFAVRLDEHLPGAEEWDNEVHWYLANGDDPTGAYEVLS